VTYWPKIQPTVQRHPGKNRRNVPPSLLGQLFGGLLNARTQRLERLASTLLKGVPSLFRRHLTLNDRVLRYGPDHQIIGDYKWAIVGATHCFDKLLVLGYAAQ
jgi:hypothetical protein